MAPTLTQNDVNKPDLNCTTCGQANEMEHTIQCEECKHWVHYVCSALPVYILLCLARTNRKYTCEKCSYEKYADPEWTAEAVAAIARQERSTATKGETIDPIQPPSSPGKPCPTEPSLPLNPPLQDVNVSTRGVTDTSELGDTPENIDLSNVEEAPVQSQEETSPRIHQNTQKGQPADNGTPSKLLQKVSAVCKFYRNGNCRYGRSGRSCRFQHPKCCQRLLNHGPHSSQGCKLRNKCPLFHPTLCRSSVSRGECFRQNCTLAHIKGTRFNRDLQVYQGESTPPQDLGVAENLRLQKGNKEQPSQNNEPNGAFLGIISEVTTRLDSLAKAMEAQASIITNHIIAQKQVSPQIQPHPVWLNTGTPWINAASTH